MNEVIEMQQKETAPVVVSMPTPADMLMVAVQSGADIEKLERLMALQERWEANQAKKAYYDAMTEFKLNPPKIEKDKEVGYMSGNGGFVGYKHATHGNVCDMVIHALAKHGITHSWKTNQPGNGLITVTCTLTHKAGHSESESLEAPPDNSGKKNTIQQIGSTVSYLQRYSLLGICGLSTVDKKTDDDGRESEPEYDIQPMVEQMQKTTTEPAAIQYWKDNNAKLVDHPEAHARLKQAIMEHRASIRSIAEREKAEAAQ